MNAESRYKAVIFDLGGTLRIALEDEPYMRHARRKMAEIAGTSLDVEAFYQLVEDRYEDYRRWALAENKESGDEELWRRWLLPDYDPVRISQVCHELSFQYRQAKGRRVLVDGGREVIETLHARGYRLGIVSNLIGMRSPTGWRRTGWIPISAAWSCPPSAISASPARRSAGLLCGSLAWSPANVSP